MRGNLLSEMLLIQEPSVFKLYEEMMKMTGYFIAPVFTIALLIEYFGEMNFGGVVKKLLLITVFMGTFFHFHTKAVELSLETASYTLEKVSPRNLFMKKWFHVKVKTKEQKQWSFLESFAIPNLNDLVATTFFLMSKVFIWLLKLIYSSVYHLTYVFSGLTAILFFLGWTKDALKGTVQASLWCMFLPFVIVAILALVGNSIDEKALAGGLIVAQVDTIIWLFGVTLLLLISPLITFGMVKGEGIHSFGSKMGAMVVSSGLKAAALAPVIAAMPKSISEVSSKVSNMKESVKDKVFGSKSKETMNFSGGEKSQMTSKDSLSKEKSDSSSAKTETSKVQDNNKESSKSKEAPSVTAQNKTFLKMDKAVSAIPTKTNAQNRNSGTQKQAEEKAKKQTTTLMDTKHRTIQDRLVKEKSIKTSAQVQRPLPRREQREQLR